MQDFLAQLREVWPLVTQASWQFALIAFVLLAAGFAVGRFTYRERLQTLRGRIESRDEEIARLKGSVAENKPDPDAIRQSGIVVGKAAGAIPHLADGYILFDHIEGNGNFNQKAEFEYRGRKLEIDSFMHSAEGNFGAIRTQVLGKVTARVVP